MNMNKLFKLTIIYVILITSVLFSSNIPSKSFLTGEDYITGEDGVIRMYVNIIGHVRNPGTYLVYDGMDFMTVLSIAGGYLDGADLGSIIIYNINGSKQKINLNKMINNGSNTNELVSIKPHDTIYVEQKVFSKIVYSSTLPSLFLSLLNILITLERTD